MKSIVALAECREYKKEQVKEAVCNCLIKLGGIENFVKKGTKVLLKPNLVMSGNQEKAICTHPEVVRAVIELIKDFGADIFLGDSPGIHSAEKVAKSCGIYDVVQETGIKLIEFTLPEKKEKIEEVKLGTMDMAQEIKEMDFCINLPKFKTHMLSTMSLSIKNCFGTIVGTKKFQWHYRAGHNEELFSKMLLDVYNNFKPDLNIIDAITGMEGNGPTSGKPRDLGFVAASFDGRALDKICAEIVNLKPENVGVLKAAIKSEESQDWQNCMVKGDPIEKFKIKDFVFPEVKPYNNMLPLFLKDLVKKVITAKPIPDQEKCIGCSICKKICPASAIEMHNNFPKIDQKKCICCYCCHELCPHSAMQTEEKLILKLLKLFKSKAKNDCKISE